MEINLPALPGLVLKIEDARPARPGHAARAGGHATRAGAAQPPGSYPTSRLQKGLLLVYRGEELAEEAVGFGVPVLKRGLNTVFPGGLRLTARRSSGPAGPPAPDWQPSGPGRRDGADWEIAALFRMCLEERLHRPGRDTLDGKPLYAIKNLLAASIRRFPALRSPLTAASSAARRTLGWETTYEIAGFEAEVTVTYKVHGEAGVIEVEVDTAALAPDGISEIAVMNEQGGRHFDRYCDSDGTCRRGAEIGCWDPVTAREAWFISDAYGLAFTLRQADGAALYRGRELVGKRLAWAGFGYTFRPAGGTFSYEVRIGEAP
jgi:hypothetical protein